MYQESLEVSGPLLSLSQRGLLLRTKLACCELQLTKYQFVGELCTCTTDHLSADFHSSIIRLSMEPIYFLYLHIGKWQLTLFAEH